MTPPAGSFALNQLPPVRFWDRLSDIATFLTVSVLKNGRTLYPADTAAADAPRAANLKPYSGCSF
jgi:hypothetical protein